MGWWAGQWYDNQGKNSWPIFVGRNWYSRKWSQYIGVFAFQWTNPHPEKAIAAISFKAAGTSSPAIWAVTIADEDFYEPETRRKTDFKRPEDAPATFFEAKLAVERKGAFQTAVKEGLIKGIREVTPLRNDLIAVTIDDALGDGGTADIVSALQVPQTFQIQSDSDAAYKAGAAPVKVGRQTREVWRGDLGAFPACYLFQHTFYLQLSTPLSSGNTYQIRIEKGLTKDFPQSISLAYDQTKTATPAIKVNQVGYSGAAKRRYAYLGYWAGDMGTVDYKSLKTFQVLDEKNQPAMQGEIHLRKAADPQSGEGTPG